MKKGPFRVGVLLDPRYTGTAAMLRGVRNYTIGHEGWIMFNSSLGDIHPQELASNKLVDGIIVHAGYGVHDIWDEAVCAAAVPTVSLELHNPPGAFMRVLADDRAVGRAGAEHLLARGLKHFGFCGFKSAYSYFRRDGFIEALNEAGYSCAVLEHDDTYSWGHSRGRLSNA